MKITKCCNKLYRYKRVLFILTALSLFNILCNSQVDNDKVYNITEAYLIDDSGQQHNILESILKNNAHIYRIADNTNDSISIIVSTVEKQVFIIGKGIHVGDKDQYMKYVEYIDEKGNRVRPDKDNVRFDLIKAGCGLFGEDNINTIVACETINKKATDLQQYYLFSFFMKDVIVQLYVLETTMQ